MAFPNENQPIALKDELVDLSTYRKQDRTAGNKHDALLVHAAYAHDNYIYQNGRITALQRGAAHQHLLRYPEDAVNQFGIAYALDCPLLLHKKLADVLIDTAIDMRDRHGLYTIAMDALRTYDAAEKLQSYRPELVTSGLLTTAGNSAHNRALAVDTKLFRLQDGALVEADEHGHLDATDMLANSRFYNGAMSDEARKNRLDRLVAWQRASVKNRLPIANLLSEFWDDRVPGSPTDFWRVISCRALCIGLDGSPKSNDKIKALREALEALETTHLSRDEHAQHAYEIFAQSWNKIFSEADKNTLETLLGAGASTPPALSDFLFHEWLQTIYDKDLVAAGFPKQLAT